MAEACYKRATPAECTSLVLSPTGTSRPTPIAWCFQAIRFAVELSPIGSSNANNRVEDGPSW